MTSSKAVTEAGVCDRVVRGQSFDRDLIGKTITTDALFGKSFRRPLLFVCRTHVSGPIILFVATVNVEVLYLRLSTRCMGLN